MRPWRPQNPQPGTGPADSLQAIFTSLQVESERVVREEIAAWRK